MVTDVLSDVTMRTFRLAQRPLLPIPAGARRSKHDGHDHYRETRSLRLEAQRSLRPPLMETPDAPSLREVN